MFDFDHYLTMTLMKDVISEFCWPQPYCLEDALPDGIILSFPKSNFAFCEGPEDIVVHFPPENTKGIPRFHLGHAMLVAIPLSQRATSPIVPTLVDTSGLTPSDQKTRDQVRDACRMILAHLTNVVKGDFSWVDEYVKAYGNP